MKLKASGMCMCVYKNINNIYVNETIFEKSLAHMHIMSCRARTGASMNPVRTLGPAVATNNYEAIWIYLTAPVLGAVCGAAAYTAIKLYGDDEAGDNLQDKPSARTRSFS